MIPKLLAVSFLLLASCAGRDAGAPGSRPPSSTSRPTVPDLHLEPVAPGPSRSLAEMVRGRVAVVDLWAAWCTACREVSARAELLAQAHAPSGLFVIGIGVGEDRESATRFLAGDESITLHYIDPAFALTDSLRVRELPLILVVDHEGNIRARKSVLDAEVVSLVERLLREESEAQP
jgi:thiol-disulfide isomerase/thioredoxin